MSKITLREATREDSAVIAKLIYLTEDNPEHVWGDGSKEDILNRIKWLVESDNSRYSYRKILVAEIDNKISGAIIVIKGSELSALDIKTSFKLISLIKGFKNKIKFIKDIILEVGLDECDDNEFYIANLATFKEYRGNGVGKALIKSAEEIAKKEGYKCCSLLAKDEGVKSFYEKLDFVFEKQEPYFSHVLYKMIKVV